MTSKTTCCRVHFRICSKKLKKKPNVTTTAADDKSNEDKAKAIIVPSVNTDYNMRMLTKQKKDYDLITEPLGEYIHFRIFH